MAVSFSKIVTTPSVSSWSQAYSAGKLFAVLSLKNEVIEESSTPIGSIGKGVLENLEAEFFTLETKDLSTIKQALLNTIEKIPQDVDYSLGVCVIVDKILYVFTSGGAIILLKREEKIGEILPQENEPRSLASSSGLLKNKDLIVIETKPFSNVIDKEMLIPSLNDLPPNEITENLAPQVQEKGEGGASTIIIKYGEAPSEDIANESTDQTDQTEEQTPPAKSFSFKKYLDKFNHSKKVFLTIAVIILFVLILSIFFALKKQQDAKINALFTEVYSSASKKYDEGNSLIDLNKTLARGSLLSSQKILNDNKDKFPKNSKQEMQILDLLKKVNNELSQISTVESKSGLDRGKLSVTVENGSGIEGAAGKVGNMLKDLGYNVTSTGNADNYNYQGVAIKVKKGKSNFMDLLKKDLSKEYTIKSTSSDLSLDSPSDALVIIGK